MNLLSKSFLKIKKVQINGFSEPFYLKELSGSALADFRNRCLDTQGELSKLNDFEKMAYLLCICNCDENGNLLQSAEDYKAVADNLSPTVLNELVDQIYKTADISGDAAKN